MTDQVRTAVASLVVVGVVLRTAGCGSSQPPGPPARSAAAAGGLRAATARYQLN